MRERRDELAELAPWLSLFGEPRNKNDQAAPPDNPKGCWNSVAGILTSPRSLDDLADRSSGAIELSDRETMTARLIAMDGAALRATAASTLRDRLLSSSDRAEALAAAMDFRPLYRPDRHLFAIGANLAKASSTAPATTCWHRNRA